MTKIIKLQPYSSEQLPILGMTEMDLEIDDQIFMSMYHEYLAQGGTEKDFKEKQAAYISQAMSAMSDEFKRVLGRRKLSEFLKRVK